MNEAENSSLSMKSFNNNIGDSVPDYLAILKKSSNDNISIPFNRLRSTESNNDSNKSLICKINQRIEDKQFWFSFELI